MVFEQKLLRLLATSRLHFRFIEHPEFQDLVFYIQYATSRTQIPSPSTMRVRLRDSVKERQQSLLQKLTPNTKLSVALDCWTSPFRQSFMAITATSSMKIGNIGRFCSASSLFLDHTLVSTLVISCLRSYKSIGLQIDYSQRRPTMRRIIVLRYRVSRNRFSHSS